ncbi:hypothetical protein F4801DRAFT_140559 [Xylaria longipes]|nr:hypothetical protein F4801DRAFT_140559 [Xylaria longipes]
MSSLFLCLRYSYVFAILMSSPSFPLLLSAPSLVAMCEILCKLARRRVAVEGSSVQCTRPEISMNMLALRSLEHTVYTNHTITSPRHCHRFFGWIGNRLTSQILCGFL